MDYTKLIISEMLFHAKMSARRINNLKKRENMDDINTNAQYELAKLYGELRALSMINLPKDETKTHKTLNRFYGLVEHFYYSSIVNCKKS